MGGLNFRHGYLNLLHPIRVKMRYCKFCNNYVFLHQMKTIKYYYLDFGYDLNIVTGITLQNNRFEISTFIIQQLFTAAMKILRG